MTNTADKPKFVHLPKPGYVLTGAGYQLGEDVSDCNYRRRFMLDWHENATGVMLMSCYSKDFDNPKDIRISKMSFNDFVNIVCFVHGDADALQQGKLCVVRNLIDYVAEGREALGYEYPSIDKAVLHLTDGVILFLGITSNMNAKVVYKSKQ